MNNSPNSIFQYNYWYWTIWGTPSYWETTNWPSSWPSWVETVLTAMCALVSRYHHESRLLSFCYYCPLYFPLSTILNHVNRYSSQSAAIMSTILNHPLWAIINHCYSSHYERMISPQYPSSHAQFSPHHCGQTCISPPRDQRSVLSQVYGDTGSVSRTAHHLTGHG